MAVHLFIARPVNTTGAFLLHYVPAEEVDTFLAAHEVAKDLGETQF